MPWFQRRIQLLPTCRFESWVKDFSQPGWTHLYGLSPVWILKTHTHMHTQSTAITFRHILKMVTQPDHSNTQRQMRNPSPVIALPVVLLQVTELSEALLAVGAGVGFHSRVDSDVLGQVAWVGEWLGTMGTLVGLRLGVVPDEEIREGEGERVREMGL